ncbi:MAG: CvpA family protein [Eubacteriales bacterium]|nr:CvpA family protein [Eubacteriales bacterium]
MTWTGLGIVTLGFLAFSCYMGFRRGFVREVVSTFFVVLSIVLVWFINPYVNDFIRENTPVYEKIQEGCQDLVETQIGGAEGMGHTEQNSMIDGLALPGFLKEGIMENNTAGVYRYLAADTFAEYVAGYLALVAVNGLSFLVSFLLASIMIRIVTYALNLITCLPIIKGANKLAGALMGGVKCIIFIWIAFLVLTVLCNTEVGKAGLQMIEKDHFLNFLYEENIFVKIFMSIFYGK